MANYVTSEERLRKKILKFGASQEEQKVKSELRKRRELLRRRIHAALYEPRMCLGDPDTGAVCTRTALPGTTMCSLHGGSTKAMQQAAKMRLLYLVEPALRVVGKLLTSTDEAIRLKAAQMLLDRAGFHPHATLEIKNEEVDLSRLSDEQLQNRAQRLIRALNESAQAEMEQIADSEDQANVIDVEANPVH